MACELFIVYIWSLLFTRVPSCCSSTSSTSRRDWDAIVQQPKPRNAFLRLSLADGDNPSGLVIGEEGDIFTDSISFNDNKLDIINQAPLKWKHKWKTHQFA